MNDLILAKKGIIEAKKIFKRIKKKTIYQKGKEVKINVDFLMDKKIQSILNKSKIKIVSEENPKSQNVKILNNCKDFWIVDPLDGSVNSIRNIPFYSICISLVENNNLKFSYIHDLYNNITYFTDNKEIKINNKRYLKKRKFIKTSQATVATGISHKSKKKDDFLSLYKFRKIRAIGSASMSLIGCLISQFDWYEEKKIMIWDVAAGVHLNMVAGCKIKSFNIRSICQDVSIGYCK